MLAFPPDYDVQYVVWYNMVYGLAYEGGTGAAVKRGRRGGQQQFEIRLARMLVLAHFTLTLTQHHIQIPM